MHIQYIYQQTWNKMKSFSALRNSINSYFIGNSQKILLPEVNDAENFYETVKYKTEP